MYFISTRWFGTFLYNEKKDIVDYSLFPNSIEELVDRMNKIESGKILNEERAIIKNRDVITDDKRLSGIARYSPDNFVDIDIDAGEYGFDINMLQRVSMILTQKRTNKFLSRKDLQLIQMIESLDDMVEISNMLSERLARWKELPEQNSSIDYVENLREKTEDYIDRLGRDIEELMRDIAPNLAEIAGPLIGARLIMLVGGLERLAKLSASSIQILGAEKALFRYKSGEGTPPKHGVIFQHPAIRKSPKDKRGKIARVLSTKIAIAARTDNFTKRDLREFLKKGMEERIKKVKNS